jgi:hypothetical protein
MTDPKKRCIQRKETIFLVSVSVFLEFYACSQSYLCATSFEMLNINGGSSGLKVAGTKYGRSDGSNICRNGYKLIGTLAYSLQNHLKP